MNAWELLLKALVSKNRKSIFRPKERNKPYETLSWGEALTQAQPFFPAKIHPLPVRRNLDLLSTYRNNAVHFYNAIGFGTLVYALAQTSIINFRDLLEESFGVPLADEINWQLLPLGLKTPIDAIEYITGTTRTPTKGGAAVKQFLASLAASAQEIEAANADTGRLLTVFTVKLESTKKIERADVVVGVKAAGAAAGEGPLVVTKTMDPNITHPLRQKDVIEKIGTLHGVTLTSHGFQAIAWKFEIRSKQQFCWRAAEGYLTRYSHDLIIFLRNLSKSEIENAVKEYTEHLKTRSKRKVAA